MTLYGYAHERIVGQKWGYRAPPVRWGDALRPVEIVKEGPARSNKVRIRWLDGEYEGLEQWVLKRRLEVRWDEADEFLDEERRTLAAIQASEDATGTLKRKAVEQVFRALSSGVPVLLGCGGGEQNLLEIENADDGARLLGMRLDELLSEPHAFIAKDGSYKAPFAVAERVALHCCRRFARDILHRINTNEAAWRQSLVTGYYDPPDGREGLHVDRDKVRAALAEDEPALALVREWCGAEAAQEYDELQDLRAEVVRLRRLVEGAAGWIKEQVNPQKAAHILKQLNQPRD